MATLIGFKKVRSDATQNKGKDDTGGQPNPTFVFDDIDVTNGKNPDESDTEQDGHQQQAPPVVNSESTPTTVNNEQPEQTEQANEINAETQAAHSDHQKTKNKSDPQPQQQPEVTTVSNNVEIEEQGSTTPPSVPPERAANRRNKPTAAVPKERLVDGDQEAANGPNSGANLNPNSRAGQDNVSVSMLSVDCIGTGKSPRTPRRSPLMALFKGKPRESVRRLYTEEDQFEIEWADLSLQIQSKWYQKLNISNFLSSKSSERDQAYQADGNAKGMQIPPVANGPQPPKKILKNVDGRIRSGEVTAVLGPSGAGKTSLLNSLFGKYRTSVHGSIKVKGAPSKKHLTVCTIPQSDYLIGYLSTQESLWFASRLKNCEDDFNHDRNIERVIELLGLQSCRHTRINKLSGGQYKRVSIAQEMLSSPDILVLDEPTSGLDSLTCYRTVKVLRDLVEASKAHNLVNPMSIILTIHQPHHEVLDLFHSVYVMAVGGLTMFQGPPSEMEARINKYSGVRMPAESYNPASFMVELASEEYGKAPIEALVRYQREKFKSSTKNRYQFQEPHPIDEIMGTYVPRDGAQMANNVGSWYKGHSTGGDAKKKTDSSITLYPLDSDSQSQQQQFVDVNLNNSSTDDKTASSNHKFYQGIMMIKDIDSRIMTPRSGKNSDGVFWRHVNLMSKRCFLANVRDPLLFTMRVMAHIFIPLVVALIYGPNMGIPNGCPFYMPEINLFEYASMGVAEIREKHDAIRIQFQNVGLHFMVYYAFGLCMLAFTAISFPLIMHVLVKEIRNGWYSLGTFILGKFVSELPLAIFLPPISVAIIYYLTGQPSSTLQWRYMVQSLILILIIMIAEAKGLVFGAICMNSMQTAVFAASVSTVPFILLSGFLIRINEIPYILQGVAKFSYFKHSVEALIITRYGFGMCPCNQSLIPPGGTPRITGIAPNLMALVDYYIVPPSPEDSTARSSLEGITTIAGIDAIGNVPGNNRSLDRVRRAIESLPHSIAAENPPAKVALVGGVIGEKSSRSRRRRWAQTSSTGARGAARKPAKTTTTTEAPTTTELVETTTQPPKKQGIFFDKMAQLLTRANAFGYQIESCDDVEPFTMKDMNLKDDHLKWLIGNLVGYIVVLKVISYYIVDFCIKLKL